MDIKQSYKGDFKEPVGEKVLVRFDMTQEIYDRLKALAKRRYGEDSYEARGKVMEDASKWLLERWDKGYYGFYDWFWSRVAFFCPFSHLKAIGYTRLVLTRYLE